MGYTPKKMTEEEERKFNEEFFRVRKEVLIPLQKRQDELILMKNTAPRGNASLKDCLDFMSRFELKPFNLVRAFPKTVSLSENPGQKIQSTFVLQLYARNLEVPQTYDDFEKCVNNANTYWVLLRFMVGGIATDSETLREIETNILSGNYDFGDFPCLCACEPIYSYLSFLADERNIPAFFKYITDPNCSKKDEKKALELYDKLFDFSLYL